MESADDKNCNNNDNSRNYGNMIWWRLTTLSELAALGGRNQIIYGQTNSPYCIQKQQRKKNNGSLEFLFSLFCVNLISLEES